MNKIISGAAVAVACLGLSGCITAAGRAAFPDLKPVELRIQSTQDCGDVAAGVVAATDQGELSSKALISLFKACTAWQAGQTVIVDPEGARKALPKL